MKHSLKHYLFKLKWIVAIAIFVVFTGFVGENCVINRLLQQQEIAQLKSEIDEYDRKFKADGDELKRLSLDKDAITEMARQRYLMKKPNEDIYVFQDENN